MAQIPIKTSKYWPHVPHIKQAAFLSLPHREALYGGAAGGGKSDAMLMAALQYVDVPGYAALLLRRTFPDLNQPGGLIPLSHEWLGGTDAKWNDQQHRWTFPSGATITFGYLQHENDKLRYQGAAYQFVGYDELTQFTQTQYRYLFSRLRKLEGSPVPLRMRGASNPGGPGHEWVKDRFVTGRSSNRVFIPARLSDNPSLDYDAYVGSLEELDHHTRRQLLEGDWDSRPPGDLFRAEWFNKIDRAPNDVVTWVRFWDLAATEPSDANPDPDWTVGLRMGRRRDGDFIIENVKRFRSRPQGVDKQAKAQAERDGIGTTIWVEQEPGSSGKVVVDAWKRTLADRAVHGYRSTGKKWDRAGVVSSKAEHGQIQIVEGAWNAAFLDELEAFTQDDSHAHDDQVDALSGAYAVLSGRGGPVATIEGFWD
jgi:predicted phage terminase large subunit-like protein